MNVYPFIEAEQAGKHNVKRACELMKVSRSAYYQHTRGERLAARYVKWVTRSTGARWAQITSSTSPPG